MDERNKILIVDDTRVNIEILLELLSDEYDVMVALDGDTAIELANEEKPDLILLDIIMPELNGYEVCKILKENLKTKDIPIIFITAKNDEESIEEAYDIGGIDYVTKPFKSKELLARVKTQLSLRRMIKHLEYISSRDPMTGIYNRRKFFELASSKFESEKNGLFAVMIDIDKFKTINDNYGHHIGDKVIKTIAQTINNLIPKKTLFGRIGGEEFALVCNSECQKDILERIELIRSTIEELRIDIDESLMINLTISSGVSYYKEEFLTIDHLLKDADIALYQAKGEGRNKTVIRKV